MIRNFKSRERTDYIIIRCTGSTEDIGVAEVRRTYLEEGYLDCGDHFVIRRSGAVEPGRAQNAPTMHGKDSVSICLVGAEEITPEQAYSLRTLIEQLMEDYPDANIYPKCTLSNFAFDQPQTGL